MSGRHKQRFGGACRHCGAEKSVLMGSWCVACYEQFRQESAHDPRPTQPDREERIRRYEERAAKGLPLFDYQETMGVVNEAIPRDAASQPTVDLPRRAVGRQEPMP